MVQVAQGRDKFLSKVGNLARRGLTKFPRQQLALSMAVEAARRRRWPIRPNELCPPPFRNRHSGVRVLPQLQGYNDGIKRQVMARILHHSRVLQRTVFPCHGATHSSHPTNCATKVLLPKETYQKSDYPKGPSAR